MTKVWIVVSGEYAEGYHVISVHGTYDGAIVAAAAARAERDYTGLGWTKDDEADYWEHANGCDVVRIIEREVEV
jgi:hypothetical protein